MGLKKAKGEGDRRWEHFDSPCGPVLVDAENRVISLADVVKVEAKYGGIFSIHYIDGTVVTATFGRVGTLLLQAPMSGSPRQGAHGAGPSSGEFGRPGANSHGRGDGGSCGNRG